MRLRVRLALLTVVLASAPAEAFEPWQPSPELVNLTAVSLVIEHHLAALDREALETDIRERLLTYGIKIVQGETLPRLRVIVETSVFESTLCPGMTTLQVRVALEERVKISRNGVVLQHAATWTDDHVASLVSLTDAHILAAQDALFLIDRFGSIVRDNKVAAAKGRK